MFMCVYIFLSVVYTGYIPYAAIYAIEATNSLFTVKKEHWHLCSVYTASPVTGSKLRYLTG